MINQQTCCGCEVCKNTCPKNAITVETNGKGFYVASIDSALCIECNLCEKVCPMLNINTNTSVQKVYAAINKDQSIVQNSSSGGVFYQLATAVISKGGVVSGVEYDNNLNAIHTITDNPEGVAKYFGSKYVQSRNNIFTEIKNRLLNDETVLYSGTPCQVAAVKNYISEIEKGTLYTVEVLCHGVGCPQIFSEHISTFDDLLSVNFRDKSKQTPTVAYVGKKETVTIDFNLDNYANGFNRCILVNDVCFNCPYATTPRSGDITIGDFWKGPTAEEIIGATDAASLPKGVSLVLINSEKGKLLWEAIKDDLFYMESDIETAKKGNRTLYAPSIRNRSYKLFWNCYKHFGYRVSMNLFCASPIYKMKYYLSRRIHS